MGAAFAALFASTAFAQSYNPSYGTGNVSSPAAEMNGGKDMAMPTYSTATAQAASAERLDGVRAEAPKAKRRRARSVSQQ
jgi:hypothetical protein